MPVGPLDFSRSAVALASSGSREIDYRNAASRAYYAAYHCALNFADRGNLPEATYDHKGGSHIRMIARFKDFEAETTGDSREIKIKSIGYQLDQVRSLRTEADYEIQLKFGKKKADMVILQVKGIMEKISEF